MRGRVSFFLEGGGVRGCAGWIVTEWGTEASGRSDTAKAETNITDGELSVY